MRRRLPLARLALAGLLLLLMLPGGAAAQALVADLNQHLVAITAGFTGTSVTLFGAIDGTGDIVVTVQGPQRETTIRHKSRVAGIWLNTEGVSFDGVPGYYRVLSNADIAQIVPPDLRHLHEIGVDALRFTPSEPVSPERAEIFRKALVDSMVANGLYSARVGPVSFLGDRLFRATLDFPANVPTGTYSIQVFLLRKGEVVAAQTTPLVIAQAGFEANLNDFAEDHATFYGVVAVLAAGLAGWFASFLFRNA